MKEKIQEIRRTLNRSIFVGERYERNMQNMLIEGYFILALAVVMVAVNILKKDYSALYAPLTFGVVDALDIFYLKVRHSRRFSVILTCITVILVFTYCIFYVDNGFAFLWTMLIPLSICYLYGVKEGMLLSIYFLLLYIIAFYTPIRLQLEGHFPDIIFERFPIMFFFNVIITVFIMYQYHKSVLFEIDHTNKLNEEVARQTALVEEKRREIEKMSLHTIEALAAAIDAKDSYTNGHSGRVAEYAREISRRTGYTEERQNEIYMMGILHDVGKIGIPDFVINKPGRLTDEEYEIIKTHPTTGALILSKTKEMPRMTIGAHWHHERYDGRGYPDGLAGTAIPEEARIIAVADAYDAMTSRRSYRDVLLQETVRREIENGKGTQFDPHFADIMLQMIDEDSDYRLRGQ